MTAVAINGLSKREHTVKFAIVKYLFVITMAINFVIDHLWWFAKEGPYKDVLFSIFIVISALLILGLLVYLIVANWGKISISWANDKTLFGLMCFVFIIVLISSKILIITSLISFSPTKFLRFFLSLLMFVKHIF